MSERSERAVHGDRGGAGSWRPAEAVIEVRGEDAWRWLQGMVPTDVLAIEPGASRRSALLERTGGLRHLLRVARPAEDGPAWLLLPAERAAAVVEELERFVIMEDVEVAVRPDLGVLAVHGAEEAARRLGAGAGATVLAAARLGPADVDLVAPAELLEGLAAALAVEGAGPLAPERLALLRVLAPDPRLGLDVSERELPLEAGLGPAVSFTKGCYTGQEAVNKMAHRGRPRRLLVRLRLPAEAASAARPGAELRDAEGAAAGHLGTVAHAPEGHLLALAVVRRAHAEPGTTLRLGEAAVQVLGAVDAPA